MHITSFSTNNSMYSICSQFLTVTTKGHFTCTKPGTCGSFDIFKKITYSYPWHFIISDYSLWLRYH